MRDWEVSDGLGFDDIDDANRRAFALFDMYGMPTQEEFESAVADFADNPTQETFQAARNVAWRVWYQRGSCGSSILMANTSENLRPFANEVLHCIGIFHREVFLEQGRK